MCATDIITAINNLVVSGAALTTATVAILGLKSWSRELKGKTEFEVGRSLISATYKLRDEMRYARSCYVRGYEFPEDYPKNLNDRTPEIEADAYSYIFSERSNQVAEALQELEIQALEGEAIWGQPIRNKTNAMKQCAMNFYVSIEAFINNERLSGVNFREDPAFRKSIRADVFGGNDDQSELTIYISAAVHALETEIRSHLKRHS